MGRERGTEDEREGEEVDDREGEEVWGGGGVGGKERSWCWE